jgi:hypothetical protein
VVKNRVFKPQALVQPDEVRQRFVDKVECDGKQDEERRKSVLVVNLQPDQPRDPQRPQPSPRVGEHEVALSYLQ